MSVGRPTVLPRDPIFPLLLPTPPQPHPVPYQKSTNLDNVRRRRNLEKEMDELSDEENELEDMNSLVRNRGFGFLIPIGRTVTQQEERNDADDESDESSSEEGEALHPWAKTTATTTPVKILMLPWRIWMEMRRRTQTKTRWPTMKMNTKKSPQTFDHPLYAMYHRSKFKIPSQEQDAGDSDFLCGFQAWPYIYTVIAGPAGAYWTRT
ncbi:hypothetical protein PTI98_003546 [Pleurotus ostreatus]|nr:hypothetical protein PTI98_003546 [Pleurotus ostreatus]